LILNEFIREDLFIDYDDIFLGARPLTLSGTKRGQNERTGKDKDPKLKVPLMIP